MEEMQQNLDHARKEFHEAIRSGVQAWEDAAWTNYMDIFAQVAFYNKANGTTIRPTL